MYHEIQCDFGFLTVKHAEGTQILQSVTGVQKR